MNRVNREKDFFSFFFPSVPDGQTRGLTTPFQDPSPSSEARRKEEEVVIHQGFHKEPLSGALLWRWTKLKRP